MSVRGRSLQALKGKVNAKYGERTLELASRVLPLVCPRVTTGSLSFDYVLGGGVPIGHVMLIHGSESSGKTTQTVRVAGNFQRLCANCYRPAHQLEVREESDPETGEVIYTQSGVCDCAKIGLHVPAKFNEETDKEFKDRCLLYEENSFEETRVAYLDVEGTFDRSWAARLGCNPDLVLLARPQTAEEAIDLHDSLARLGAVDLIVIDSIASMTPRAEVVESAENWQQGLQARLINKFARKTNSARTAVSSDFDRPLTEIWINQERMKIGVMFGDPTVIPGGNAQRFAASVAVKMWPSKVKKETMDADLKEDWQTDIGTDILMNFKVWKNKTWRPHGQGGFRMGLKGALAGEVLDIDYMMVQAERFGLLRKDGNKWQLGDETYKTKAAVTERIQERQVRDHLRRVLVQQMIERE